MSATMMTENPPARIINRAWEWVAVRDDGFQFTERDFASINNVPGKDRIRRLTLHRTGSDPNTSRQFSVFVPEGCDPVVFSRHSINVQAGIHNAITVIGWEDVEGKTLLWVTDDGDACMTDRDVNDLE